MLGRCHGAQVNLDAGRAEFRWSALRRTLLWLDHRSGRRGRRARGAERVGARCAHHGRRAGCGGSGPRRRRRHDRSDGGGGALRSAHLCGDGVAAAAGDAGATSAARRSRRDRGHSSGCIQHRSFLARRLGRIGLDRCDCRCRSPSAASPLATSAVRDIRENGIAMRCARFATGDAPGRSSALGWGDDDLGSRRRLYRRCHQRGGRHRGGDRRRLRTFARTGGGTKHLRLGLTEEFQLLRIDRRRRSGRWRLGRRFRRPA